MQKNRIENEKADEEIVGIQLVTRVTKVKKRKRFQDVPNTFFSYLVENTQ